MKKLSMLILSLIFLVIFVIIALSIGPLAQIDNSVSLFSATHQIPILQNISIFLSNIFEPIYVIIFVIILSVLLWTYKKKKHAILLALASLSGGVFIYILKHILTRERPTNSIIAESGFSLPSGHALISVILFGMLIYFSIKIKSKTKKILSILICSISILLVGLSRVYLNVHWFSDVIAGYCFGLFLLLLILFIQKSLYK